MQKLIFINANISDFNVYERDLQAMEKHFISAQQLLEDSFKLAWKIYQSGYRPNYIVGVWRGGAPIGIAAQEFLDVPGIESDHKVYEIVDW